MQNGHTWAPQENKKAHGKASFQENPSEDETIAQKWAKREPRYSGMRKELGYAQAEMSHSVYDQVMPGRYVSLFWQQPQVPQAG